MKHRTPGYVFIPLVLVLILGVFMMIIPVDFIPKNGLKYIPYNAFHQLENVFSYWVVWVVLFIAFLILLGINRVNKAVESRKFDALTPEEQAKYLEEDKEGYFKRLFRSGSQKQSDEEEDELILDHGFDGILELDNALPQWWVALFWLGTIYMVIYMVAYFTTDFAHPIDEYEMENTRMEAEFASWIKRNDINVEEASLENANVEHGKEIFQNICATCHTANGGGAAGPNLTDDYWINKLNDDLYKNIYTMAYDGSPNNPAMQAFGQTKQLTGLDIQDVAAYVYSLNQDVPEVTEAEGGLAPQGEKRPEWARKQ